MSRIDVIRQLVGRKKVATYAPKGMAHPGETATAPRPVRYRRTGKYQSRGLGFIRDFRVGPGRPRIQPEIATFKTTERHEPHWLTRVAEKLKRGWHG